MKATRRIFQSHEKEIPPDRKRCHRRSVEEEQRRKNMQIIKVMWEGINELDIRTLTEMSEDGYLFEIDDGRIQKILMLTGTSK